MNELLRPRDLQRLQGQEGLGPGQIVLDFWRWALGDLRMNTARGYLVEYLVAKALGDKSPVRVEWGPHDVEAADGTLVEIKTAGYLQSWATKKLSTPSWTFKSVMADKVWSEDLGSYLPVDPGARVHVWVFALQTCQDPRAYNPLSIDQWKFRVMPHRQLLATGQRSAGLAFFDRLGVSAVPYSKLASAVRTARLRTTGSSSRPDATTRGCFARIPQAASLALGTPAPRPYESEAGTRRDGHMCVISHSVR